MENGNWREERGEGREKRGGENGGETGEGVRVNTCT